MGGKEHREVLVGEAKDRRSEGPKAGILSVRLDQSELGSLEQRGQENRNEEVWS